MNKIIKIISLVTVLALTSCAEYTRSGKLKDTIFGVEERGNGATVVWMTHDDVGSYCFFGEEANKAKDLFNNYNGLVIVTYDDGALFDGCPSSGSKTHVYTARTINKVEEK